MARYFFYAAANARQDEIWSYTVRNWGEAQAEFYIRGLHDHLEALVSLKKTQHRKLSSVIPDLGTEVFYSRYREHYVFYRLFSDGDIGILTILHTAMDGPARLHELLKDDQDNP